jgi:hypothetical protein
MEATLGSERFIQISPAPQIVNIAATGSAVRHDGVF